MNHVPNTAVEAIDTFGRSRLFGNPKQVDEKLREDLSIKIRPMRDVSVPITEVSRDASDSDRRRHTNSNHESNTDTVHCRYETVHTHTPSILRDRGSFVTTIVDAIDSRLRSWGIDPPTAYSYTNTIDGIHWYEGRLEPR